jgi:hypothetical protein
MFGCERKLSALAGCLLPVHVDEDYAELFAEAKRLEGVFKQSKRKLGNIGTRSVRAKKKSSPTKWTQVAK